MRRRARVDRNQKELVQVWRELGGSVLHTHTIPRGLDLIVGYGGIDQRVEIKDGSLKPSARRLTSYEQETILEWKGRPPVIWCQEEDVHATWHELRLEMLARKKLLRRAEDGD